MNLMKWRKYNMICMPISCFAVLMIFAGFGAIEGALILYNYLKGGRKK